MSDVMNVAKGVVQSGAGEVVYISRADLRALVERCEAAEKCARLLTRDYAERGEVAEAIAAWRSTRDR